MISSKLTEKKIIGCVNNAALKSVAVLFASFVLLLFISDLFSNYLSHASLIRDLKTHLLNQRTDFESEMYLARTSALRLRAKSAIEYLKLKSPTTNLCINIVPLSPESNFDEVIECDDFKHKQIRWANIDSENSILFKLASLDIGIIKLKVFKNNFFQKMFNTKIFFILLISIVVSIFTQKYLIKNLYNNVVSPFITNVKIVTEQEATIELSRQVAHDIRSPLTALNLMVTGNAHLPEQERITIRNATQRINDIANNLLFESKSKYQKELDTPTATKSLATKKLNARETALLTSLVDEVVSEKRAGSFTNQSINILSDFYASNVGLFSNISKTDFQSIISNLIENGVEAIEGSHGFVKVILMDNDEQNIVRIQDTGKGMSERVLKQLGQKGFTHGKLNLPKSGAGLGVYHAKSVIESWGGELIYDSVIGSGTVVDIILPKAKAPNWFLDKLVIKNEYEVIVLDDDKNIFHVWKERMPNTKVKYARGPIEFCSLIDQQKFPTLFLCDYELFGHRKTGLDLIIEQNITEKSILVTSRFDDPAIIEACNQANVKILPKNLAHLVPVFTNVATFAEANLDVPFSASVN